MWKWVSCCTLEILFPAVTFSLDSPIVLIVSFKMVKKVVFQKPRLSKAMAR